MNILSFGSLNVDHVYQVDHINEPSETQKAQSYALFPGGKGLNQSLAAARAGCRVFQAGAVGEDGQILLDALKQSGVDTRHVKKVPGSSAHTVIQVDRHGQNSILVFSGPHLSLKEEEMQPVLDDFGKGDFLLVQNEADGTGLVMEKAVQKGMILLLNPSPVTPALFSYPLSCVDWFLLNETEGHALTGETEPQRILAGMKRQYPKAGVVLTLGSDGAYCAQDGQVVYQPAFSVEVVDTTAAGDTFAGYFAAGLAQGESLAMSMKRAAKAAALAVSRPGAALSIPKREEVSSL